MSENTERTAEQQQEDKIRVVGRPFLPGVSGNPNGRPKGTVSIVGAIRIKLEELPTPDSKKTYLELVVDRILQMAIQDKNEQMLKMIANYIDGMPRQPINVSADEDTIKMIADAIKTIANDKDTGVSSETLQK